MSAKEAFAYDPNQAYLLPPNAKDVLGSFHVCFRVHTMAEQLDVSRFEEAMRMAYPPSMMLKVWLYAFCLGVNSTRRLERRIQEDLAFRYLAGGLEPDHKTLSEFLRRHRRAINDVFTQVVQMARRAGLGKLGHVAIDIDSTRVRANAARRSMMDWEEAQRQQCAGDRRLVRAFQQKASQSEPEEDSGVHLSPEQQQALERQAVPAAPHKCAAHTLPRGVVASGSASTNRGPTAGGNLNLARDFWRSGFEEPFLAIDHGINIVGGELESVAVRDRVGRAGFDAVSAEDAPRIIDIVDAGVAFACRDALCFGIVGGFDIDTPGRTSRGTEKAANAFFETVFVTLQNVDTAIASLKMYGLLGIIFGGRLSPKVAKRDTEAFGQGRDRAANFL